MTVEITVRSMREFSDLCLLPSVSQMSSIMWENMCLLRYLSHDQVLVLSSKSKSEQCTHSDDNFSFSITIQVRVFSILRVDFSVDYE